MKDDEMKIMRIIFIIRECLKENLDNFPNSCCFESSLIAEKVFTELGFNIQVIEGEFDGMEHYWNIINGFLCDLSSDQFREPYGIIQNPIKYYQIDRYVLKEQLEEFNNDGDEYEDIYKELKDIEDLVNKISFKCLKRVKLYKCA